MEVGGFSAPNQLGKGWENHGKTMVNSGKTMVKSW